MSTETLPALRAIFDSLPNPLIILDEDNQVCMVNGTSEDFFQTSKTVLMRHKFADLMPFSSPAMHAVQQVRELGGVVNEYEITVGTPRMGGERVVDLQTAIVAEDPRFILVMLLRRSMAHKFDMQLSHQGAARSVSGMASMLAHEIKNPLSGIRGAAQLLEPGLADGDRALARLICDETDRIRDLVDQMEVFSDERPLERQSINIHIVLYRVKQLIMASAGGNEPDPAKFFGFFALLMILGIVMALLLIVISVLFVFTYPLIVERKLSGLDAVKLSARAGLANFWPLLGLLLLNGLLGFAGLLFCYVGMFLVLPVTFGAIATAYEQVFGLGGGEGPRLPPPPPSFNQSGC